jgi:multicomponent Na+:H+ antiporter subunit D
MTPMFEPVLALLAKVNPGLLLVAAGVLMLVARGTPLRAAVLLGGPAAALAALLMGPVAWAEDWTVSQAMGLELVSYRVDSLSFVFGVGFILAAALCGMFSLHRQSPLQDAAALVYAGGAVGAVFSGDLITLFLFWETTALASAVLVFAGGRPGSVAAAMRYLLFQLLSGLLVLGGAAWLAAEGAPTTYSGLAPLGLQPLLGILGLSTPAGVMIFLGFGIKAGFPLLHAWLPDAYPRASETGAVILSAFTTKLAVYALLRCFAGTEALIWIGAAMALLPAVLALHEDDLRRVLCYSLIGQVGFMVCGAGVGTSLAVNGAVAHAFASLCYQTLLFMSLGAVMLRTGATRASDLGGLYRTMPLTALAAIVGSLSLCAVPLFAGFAGKSMTVSAIEGQKLFGPWLMLLAASAAMVVHTGLRVPLAVFFGRDRGLRPAEAPFNMLLAMGLAGALTVGIGSTPSWLYDILPFRDEAMEYLRGYFWKPAHVLLQLELVLFAALAFVGLRQAGWLAQERAGRARDADWLVWKAAPVVIDGLWTPIARAAGGVVRLAVSLGSALKEDGRQFFSHGKLMSLKFPLDATVLWTMVLLALVLLIALFY